MRNGFTIVELLVSISILVFIASGSFGAYRAVARREVLDSAHQQIRTNFSYIRQQALSVVRSTSCIGPLNAYRVTFDDNRNYTASVVCGAGAPVRDKTYELPVGTEFTTTQPNTIFYN